MQPVQTWDDAHPLASNPPLPHFSGATIMTDAPRLNPPILIIEDETTQRRLLLNQLQSQGYQVVAASSGREGLDLWAERPDIRMVIT